MKTYFLSLVVEPIKGNLHADRISEALAHFWVVDTEMDNVVIRVKHFLSEYMWKIQSWEQRPIETNASQYPDRDKGLMHYLKAQQTGFASYFLGVSRKGWNDPDLGESFEL